MHEIINPKSLKKIHKKIKRKNFALRTFLLRYVQMFTEKVFSSLSHTEILTSNFVDLTVNSIRQDSLSKNVLVAFYLRNFKPKYRKRTYEMIKKPKSLYLFVRETNLSP